MSVSGDVNNYYIRHKMLDSSYLRSDAAILKSIQSDPRETTACFLAGGLQRHGELDVSSFEKRLGLITKVKNHRRAFSRARLDTVYANSSIALAVTSKSFEDEYRRFVLRLSRENSRWLVTDVQIEMRKEEGGALRDFLKKYPDARIVPNAMRVKHTDDVNPEQT